MARITWPAVAGFAVLAAAACATSPTAQVTAPHSPAPSHAVTPAAAPAAAALPPYAIETLRERPRAPGRITVGDAIGGGPGYAKHHVSWVSDASSMTGVLDIPAGAGRFPVVLVNHGYAPVSHYYRPDQRAADASAGGPDAELSRGDAHLRRRPSQARELAGDRLAAQLDELTR